ncbi:glyceraldehyde 3-phosphate dehydrogenase NAD-binding domain-containing protein, partial [Paenibacillus xylanexedens]|uniref:glyceraldehyde 3-phosphate dehydrogenase NAD-binding domain-containing protein n=1 Tax=Paenibacillus xylanexedens TaxID=528191 RepID=UPI0028CB7E66
MEVVGMKDLSDGKMVGDLVKHDRSEGGFAGDVEVEDGLLKVKGKEVKVLGKGKWEEVGWGEVGVDMVVECS